MTPNMADSSEHEQELHTRSLQQFVSSCSEKVQIVQQAVMDLAMSVVSGRSHLNQKWSTHTPPRFEISGDVAAHTNENEMRSIPPRVIIGHPMFGVFFCLPRYLTNCP